MNNMNCFRTKQAFDPHICKVYLNNYQDYISTYDEKDLNIEDWRIDCDILRLNRKFYKTQGEY